MPNLKPWGAGRIVFMARLDVIKSEIFGGFPLTTIYERHREALGINYPSFTKLVNRYAADAKPVVTERPRYKPHLANRSQQTTQPQPRPSTPTGAPTHARYDAGHDPFPYDGTPRQDDIARLIGPPADAKK